MKKENDCTDTLYKIDKIEVNLFSIFKLFLQIQYIILHSQVHHPSTPMLFITLLLTLLYGLSFSSNSFPISDIAEHQSKREIIRQLTHISKIIKINAQDSQLTIPQYAPSNLSENNQKVNKSNIIEFTLMKSKSSKLDQLSKRNLKFKSTKNKAIPLLQQINNEKSNSSALKNLPIMISAQKVKSQVIIIKPKKEIQFYSQQNNNLINRNLQTISTPINNSIEYVKNGNFANTACPVICCIYNTQDYTQLSVFGWIPDPEIQIGAVQLYKSGQSNYNVIQLAAFQPTCIKQNLKNLPNGFYQLNYTFTARNIISLTESKISFYLDNVLVDQRLASSYDWQYASVSDIRIEGMNGSNVSSKFIKVCGDSSLGGYGNLLSSVSLRRTKDLPSALDSVNTSTNSTQLNTTTQTNSTTQTNNQNTINPQYQTTINQNKNTIQDMLKMDLNSLDIKSLENITNLNITDQNSNSLIDYAKSSPLFTQTRDTIFMNQIFNFLRKVPGGRQVFSNFFSFFINMDHLWLYIYHKRNYSQYIISTFLNIDNIQSTKWDSGSQEIQLYTIDLGQLETQLDQKRSQTPLNFFLLQNQSRSFLVNNYKFFITNIPQVLVIFVIVRILQKILLKCNIKDFLKQFSFNSFLIIVFFQGNTESFVYFLLSDIKTLFSRNTIMKAQNFSSIIFMFILMMLLLAGPFILRYLQRKDKDIFVYDNCKNTLKGSIYFIVDFGVFNMVLGSVHILAEDHPNLQLGLLLGFETAFSIFNIVNLMKRKKVFDQAFYVIMTIQASFLRAGLIISLFIYDREIEDSVKNKVEWFQKICFTLYLGLWMISFGYTIVVLIINVVKNIYKKIKQLIRQKKNQQHKKRQNEDKLPGKNRIANSSNITPINLIGSSNDVSENPKLSKLKQIRIKRQIKKKTMQTINIIKINEKGMNSPMQKTLSKATTRKVINLHKQYFIKK